MYAEVVPLKHWQDKRKNKSVDCLKVDQRIVELDQSHITSQNQLDQMKAFRNEVQDKEEKCFKLNQIISYH